MKLASRVDEKCNMLQAKPTAVASTASVIRLAPNASAAFVVDSPVESLGRRRHLSSKRCPASDVYLHLCMNPASDVYLHLCVNHGGFMSG